MTPGEVEEAIVAENRVRAGARVREAARQRELRTLLRHVATYVIVGAFSYVLNVRLTGGVWYFWVLLGWGLVLALHVGRAAKVDRRIAARVVARTTGEPSAGEGPRERPGASGRPRPPGALGSWMPWVTRRPGASGRHDLPAPWVAGRPGPRVRHDALVTRHGRGQSRRGPLALC